MAKANMNPKKNPMPTQDALVRARGRTVGKCDVAAEHERASVHHDAASGA